jgi:hypothetical protein
MAEEKKIYVDEDWKDRVQAEKEEAKAKAQAAQADDQPPDQPPDQPAEQPEDAGGEPAEGARPEAPPKEIKWPEPSLQLLATSLASQAMVTLGVLPHPITKKHEADLGQAKHLIDTLELLMRKTEGNRTEQETRDLDGMLHELRMAFVAVKQAVEGGGAGASE